MPRILVIDDSPSTLESVAMMLAGAGHQVCSCASGKRAREMIEHEQPDLILTDIFMPEEDGLEVIREARRLRPDLPIVAMSGVRGELDMLPLAQYLGASQLLRKPFTSPDLLAAVEMALATPPLRPAAGEREAPPMGGTGHCQ